MKIHTLPFFLGVYEQQRYVVPLHCCPLHSTPLHSSVFGSFAPPSAHTALSGGVLRCSWSFVLKLLLLHAPAVHTPLVAPHADVHAISHVISHQLVVLLGELLRAKVRDSIDDNGDDDDTSLSSYQVIIIIIVVVIIILRVTVP